MLNFHIPDYMLTKIIVHVTLKIQGLPGGSVVRNLPANAGNMGLIPGSGGSLEKEMATHSSTLA